ncbi:transmembrane protein 59-like isoform X1 [Hemiscyllium ocellatum]|uniref:transmembrane protein 59-like isoform X1 n=1 Tax=Hemiscyllium ocellatum TaxID=170820 RepID=UPI0029670776|nr:transmembrane protein 59-like isoform X1 [Hemiscyllium ocellatum]
MEPAATCPGAALLLLLSAAAATCSPAAVQPFDSLLGDTARCQSRCRNIFLLERQPTEVPLSTCQRGCRLFSICQFVDGVSDLNSTRAECEAACFEAYYQMEEQNGCNTGCKEQFLQAERRRTQHLTPPPEPSSIFDYVSTLCSDIVSSAQSFISSTWTFYLQADDGKVVVFQAHPELELSAPDLQAMQFDMGQVPPEWNPSEHEKLIPQTAVRHGAEKKVSVRPDPEFKQAPVRQEGSLSQHDFLGCMSRRSGLPRWILAACLVLSILVMLWLSCASLVTAPEQHVKSQPLSINGDQDGMEKTPSYGLTPLITMSLREQEEENVGPLPVKVDLRNTLI